MKHRFILLFIVVLLQMSGLVFAQQDSIKYQIMKVFTILDSKKTDAFFVRNQKTFTVNDRLIREITFNDSTRQTQSYTFYFYKNSKLFSEECHDKNDSLLYIILHKYDPKGREAEIDRLEWIKGKMKPVGRTIYVYNKAGDRIEMKELSSRKKPFRITRYFYSSGNLIWEKCKETKFSDNKVEQITEYQYGDDGKVESKKIMKINNVDTVITRIETYFYDARGQLKTNEIKNLQGKVILSKNYEYDTDGSLRNYYEKDEAEKMVLYYSFVLKLYKINLGTQKSYFDNK